MNYELELPSKIKAFNWLSLRAVERTIDGFNFLGVFLVYGGFSKYRIDFAMFLFLT